MRGMRSYSSLTRLSGTTSTGWPWMLAAAATAGAASAIASVSLASMSQEDDSSDLSKTTMRLRSALLAPLTAIAEAPSPQPDSARAQLPSLTEAQRIQRFKEWLQLRGVNMDGVEIKPSKVRKLHEQCLWHVVVSGNDRPTGRTPTRTGHCDRAHELSLSDSWSLLGRGTIGVRIMGLQATTLPNLPRHMSIVPQPNHSISTTI